MYTIGLSLIYISAFILPPHTSKEVIVWASPKRALYLKKQPLEYLTTILKIESIAVKEHTKQSFDFMYCTTTYYNPLVYPHKMFILQKFIEWINYCHNSKEPYHSKPIEAPIETATILKDAFSLWVCASSTSLEARLVTEYQILYQSNLRFYIDSSQNCQNGIYFYNKFSGLLYRYDGLLQLNDIRHFLIESAAKGLANLTDLGPEQLSQIITLSIPIVFIYSKKVMNYLNLKHIMNPRYLNVFVSDIKLLNSVIGKDEYTADINIVIVPQLLPLRHIVKYKFQDQFLKKNITQFYLMYNRKKIKPYIYRKSKRINALEIDPKDIKKFKEKNKPYILYLYESCRANCREAIKLLWLVKEQAFKNRLLVAVFDVGSYFTHPYADLGQGLFLFWRTKTKKIIQPISLSAGLKGIKETLKIVTKLPMKNFFKDDYLSFDLGSYF